jgi:hypothetical protein
MFTNMLSPAINGCSNCIAANVAGFVQVVVDIRPPATDVECKTKKLKFKLSDDERMSGPNQCLALQNEDCTIV